MIKNKLNLLFILLGFALQAQEEPGTFNGRVFTLEQAQQYAIENGYSVRNSVYEIEKAQKTMKETVALFLPQVSANFDVTYNAKRQPIAFPTDTEGGFIQFPPNSPDYVYFAFGGGRYQNVYGLNANWMIGSYSNFLAKQGTEVLKEISDLDKQQAELLIRTDVSKAFYQVLVWEESVRLLEENLEPLQKSLFENRQLFQNGFMEEQDVDQIELLVSSLDNSLKNAERQEVLAMQMLKFQMGIPLEENINVTGDLEADMQSAANEVLNIGQNTLDVEQHVNYRIANSQYKAQVLNYKNEKADYVPTLSLNGAYTGVYATNNYQENFFDTYWAPALFITGSLKWDLFTGLSRSAQVQKAQIDVDKAELNKELTENQLKLQYQQARSDFLFALDNYRTEKKNVDLSMRIRDKTMTKYQEGISSSLDFTQAQNQYIEAQRNFVNAMQQLLFAKQELDKAIGK